jgi:hypothetical protein
MRYGEPMTKLCWATFCVLALSCQPAPTSNAPATSQATTTPPAPTSPIASAPASAPAPQTSTTPVGEPWLSFEELVKALKTDLPTSIDAAALEALRIRAEKTPGVKSAVSATSFVALTIAPDKPLKATVLADILGWKNVFTVSGVVHQTSWYLALYTQDVPDQHRRRIAVDTPKIGPWRIRAYAEGRPAGPLPGIAAGASPAYPLKSYPVDVATLEISADQ